MDQAMEKMNSAVESVRSSENREAPAAPDAETLRKALGALEAKASAGLDDEGNAVVTEKSVAGREDLETAVNDYVNAVKDYASRMQSYADGEKTDNEKAKADYNTARDEYLAERDKYTKALSEAASLQGASFLQPPG